MTKNYRKITVGDNFSSCIAYVKGISYLNRKVRISDIVESDSVPNALDIYVIHNNVKDAGTILWKTIDIESILEFEYDLNFE